MEFKRVKCCSNCKFAEHDYSGGIDCTNQNHPEPAEVNGEDTFYPSTQHDFICEFWEDDGEGSWVMKPKEIEWQ